MYQAFRCFKPERGKPAFRKDPCMCIEMAHEHAFSIIFSEGHGLVSKDYSLGTAVEICTWNYQLY